jgi:flavin-dependent dehydrogenase
MRISVTGAGLAGSAAAIAARRAGAAVELIERSRHPRHKVCGEFLSPEIARELDRLGLWSEFRALGPARMTRMVLRFAKREKQCRLPEPAWGLSRYQLDWLLHRAALNCGAWHAESPSAQLRVIATGRRGAAPNRDRLFGFKAHFTGPIDDAVELYFIDRGYVGVSPVEDHKTNVCGLVPESVLRATKFEVEGLLKGPVAERLKPLERAMDWMFVGPLVFENHFTSGTGPGEYMAGDCLSFVDPFTGSGMLAALLTGRLAGEAAATGRPVEHYLRDCRRSLGRPFEVASLFRAVLKSGWADLLSAAVPSRLLFALTRPAAG